MSKESFNIYVKVRLQETRSLHCSPLKLQNVLKTDLWRFLADEKSEIGCSPLAEGSCGTICQLGAADRPQWPQWPHQDKQRRHLNTSLRFWTSTSKHSCAWEHYQAQASTHVFGGEVALSSSGHSCLPHRPLTPDNDMDFPR